MAATRAQLPRLPFISTFGRRSEEHTSELQSQFHLVCRLLLEKNTRFRRHLSPVHGRNEVLAARDAGERIEDRLFVRDAAVILVVPERQCHPENTAGDENEDGSNEDREPEQRECNHLDLLQLDRMANDGRKELSFLAIGPPSRSTLFPYTTLFR